MGMFKTRVKTVQSQNELLHDIFKIFKNIYFKDKKTTHSHSLSHSPDGHNGWIWARAKDRSAELDVGLTCG